MLAGPKTMETRFEIFDARHGFLTSRPNAPWDKHPTLHALHVPGLPVEQAQYCRLSVVGANGRMREHLVFMSYQPMLSSETCAEIAGLLGRSDPEATPTFLRDQDGRQCETMAGRNPAEAAAAVAEAIRSGTLGDIEWVEVRLNEQDFKVQVHWEGDHAAAKVIAAAG